MDLSPPDGRLISAMDLTGIGLNRGTRMMMKL